MTYSAVQQIKEAAQRAVLEAYGLVEKRASGSLGGGIGAGVGALAGLGAGHLYARHQGDDENANQYRLGGAMVGGMLGGGVGVGLGRYLASGQADPGAVKKTLEQVPAAASPAMPDVPALLSNRFGQSDDAAFVDNLMRPKHDPTKATADYIDWLVNAATAPSSSPRSAVDYINDTIAGLRRH